MRFIDELSKIILISKLLPKKMNKISIAVLMLFSVAASCQTPKLVLSDDLQANTTEMKVKGRQGWQINQVIRYGDYSTSRVRRGWTTGYNISFVLRFQKAEEKLSFSQMTSDGGQAEVLAVGRFKNTEYDLLKGFLSYSVKYENSFAGSIIPTNDSGNVWEFIVYNPDGDLSGNADCGVAKDKGGHEIIIRGIRKLDKQPKWMQFANYGFEFVENGKAIAAVSTINNGRVWISNNVDANRKLVISSLATSLLLRHSMEDAVPDR